MEDGINLFRPQASTQSDTLPNQASREMMRVERSLSKLNHKSSPNGTKLVVGRKSPHQGILRRTDVAIAAGMRWAFCPGPWMMIEVSFTVLNPRTARRQRFVTGVYPSLGVYTSLNRLLPSSRERLNLAESEKAFFFLFERGCIFNEPRHSTSAVWRWLRRIIPC